jgi:hypothetical protein
MWRVRVFEIFTDFVGLNLNKIGEISKNPLLLKKFV